MRRVTVAQLALLKFVQKRRDGVTVGEAAEHFGVSNQSVQIRFNAIRELGWVSRKALGSASRAQGSYSITKAGTKLLAQSWKTKKGARFATLAA